MVGAAGIPQASANVALVSGAALVLADAAIGAGLVAVRVGRRRG